MSDFDDDFEGDDAGDDDDVDDINRIVGALPKSVLTYLAKSIVEDPDAVVVDTEERRNSVTLRLHVAQSDMGRVIGRRGRVAQAIRSVVRAAGAREGFEATVDIVD